MGYNKKNFYLKVLEIQETHKQHSQKGATNVWIYRNLIAPNYFISLKTYYNYLGINARRELRLAQS